MFADYTKLFLSNKDINKLFNDINVDLQKISIQFKASKLSLTKMNWALFIYKVKKRLFANDLPMLYKRKSN